MIRKLYKEMESRIENVMDINVRSLGGTREAFIEDIVFVFLRKSGFGSTLSLIKIFFYLEGLYFRVWSLVFGQPFL